MRSHVLCFLLSTFASTSAVAQESAADMPESRAALDALEQCSAAADAGRRSDADDTNSSLHLSRPRKLSTRDQSG